MWCLAVMDVKRNGTFAETDLKKLQFTELIRTLSPTTCRSDAEAHGRRKLENEVGIDHG